MPISPETGTLQTALDRGGTVRTGDADATAAELEEWAAAHNRVFVQLDTVDCSSGEELIDALADAFAFPEDSAGDWDEVDEALGDFDVSPAEGLLVVWTSWDSIAMDDERGMAVAVDVLRTAAQSWCDDGVPWTVLVVGSEGPAWDLSWAGPGRAPWEVDADEDEFEEDEDDAAYGADVAHGVDALGSRWG